MGLHPVAGDVVRVTKFYPDHELVLPAIALCTGGNDANEPTILFLETGMRPGRRPLYIWLDVNEDEWEVVSVDDLTDEEVTALMKFTLTEGL